MTRIRCAFCSEFADHYYVTLDNTLWSVCSRHGSPFARTAVELDPETYDLDAYFERLYEEEPAG